MDGKLKTHLFNYGLISEFKFNNYSTENVKDEILYSDDRGYFIRSINITETNTALRIITLDYVVEERYYPQSQINFENPIYFKIDEKNSKIYWYQVETKPQTKGDYLVRH